MLISLEFLYHVPSYRAFHQIKIRHVFIMQFGGYFVKFYSRQIFWPYGTSNHRVLIYFKCRTAEASKPLQVSGHIKNIIPLWPVKSHLHS